MLEDSKMAQIRTTSVLMPPIWARGEKGGCHQALYLQSSQEHDAICDLPSLWFWPPR